MFTWLLPRGTGRNVLGSKTNLHAKGVLLAHFISGYVARRFSTLCLGFVLLILHTQWAKQHPCLKFTHGVWRHCGTALSNSHLRSGIVFQAISYLDGGCKVESRFIRHRMAHRISKPYPSKNKSRHWTSTTYLSAIHQNSSPSIARWIVIQATWYQINGSLFGSP